MAIRVPTVFAVANFINCCFYKGRPVKYPDFGGRKCLQVANASIQKYGLSTHTNKSPIYGWGAKKNAIYWENFEKVLDKLSGAAYIA